MKMFKYFILLILTAVSLGSCVVNKDRTDRASQKYRNNTNRVTMKQGGYEYVHSRPQINRHFKAIGKRWQDRVVSE